MHTASTTTAMIAAILVCMFSPEERLVTESELLQPCPVACFAIGHPSRKGTVSRIVTKSQRGVHFAGRASSRMLDASYYIERIRRLPSSAKHANKAAGLLAVPRDCAR
jgi:hypothetical protein